ncbi:hypothetical protein PQ610_07080 [Tardisphaera miroshnichenkoae]
MVDEQGRPLCYISDHELLKKLEEGKEALLSDLALHEVPRVQESSKAQDVPSVFEK